MAVVHTLGIDHVDLTVTDLGRSLPFYETVLSALGFARQPAEKDAVWASPHMSLAVRAPAPEHRGATFSRYRVGLHHLAFRAASRADVDRFHAFLVRQALPVLDPPADYPHYGAGYYAVFFADPDGMKLELVHFPAGYWHRAQTTGRDDRTRHPA